MRQSGRRLANSPYDLLKKSRDKHRKRFKFQRKDDKFSVFCIAHESLFKYDVIINFSQFFFLFLFIYLKLSCIFFSLTSRGMWHPCKEIQAEDIFE
jgi:hypothetical protein